MSLQDIKKIREVTGIGVLSAKNVLEQAGGDLDCALELVQSEGERIAIQRTVKPTKASSIGYYDHGDQKNCSNG